MLTGNHIENNTYCYFDEDITPEEIKIAKKAAYDAVKLYKQERRQWILKHF